jgi:catechol 2,3-dioxygenase-like lactoylglutathione lyase family enzyme
VILGVSHVVLGVGDIERERAWLESLGYTLEFVQRGIATHPGKRAFMRTDSDSQAMAFFRRGAGTALELIEYVPDPPAGVAPIDYTLPASAPDDAGSPVDPLLSRAWTLAWPSRAAPTRRQTPSGAWLTFAGDEQGAGVIVHRVPSLADALAYWKRLRFTVERSGDGWAVCSFRALTPAWSATLLLVEDPAYEPRWWLDGQGYRCLSVLCSSLDKDRAAALLTALEPASTGAMDLEVNRKPLRVELLAAPGGLMLELLQISTQRSD